jgi:hypothetical protein
LPHPATERNVDRPGYTSLFLRHFEAAA